MKQIESGKVGYLCDACRHERTDKFPLADKAALERWAEEQKWRTEETEAGVRHICWYCQSPTARSGKAILGGYKTR